MEEASLLSLKLGRAVFISLFDLVVKEYAFPFSHSNHSAYLILFSRLAESFAYPGDRSELRSPEQVLVTGCYIE